MNIKLKKSLLVLILVSGCAVVTFAHQHIATADPLGNTNNQTSVTSASDDSPELVPIPDGMNILLLLACGYGVFKYFQVRKQVKMT